MEDVRSAVFPHEAVDSEELCEEALRCETCSVSPDMYHRCSPYVCGNILHLSVPIESSAVL